MKHLHAAFASILALAVGAAGCDRDLARPELPTEGAAEAHLPPEGSYEFAAPVFDIAAAPDGSILVAEGTTIKEIRKGSVAEVVEIPTLPGSPVNGLETIGRGSFFATSGGLDLAAGAGLWRASRGGARLVADIASFEIARDPDAFQGPQWKDQRCEAVDGFSAGPQSNPYHLATLSGNEALIADAAGNTLLRARVDGRIDWVAVFTPPVDENGEWMVRFQLDDGTNCYVQPVPTSVAIGPDGGYYVGELTGTTANFADPTEAPGLSRVWRIAPGARHVVCPSAACREILSGLTSVIDLAFGADGKLYLVEYDRNGWFQAIVFGNIGGGTIKRCDVRTRSCEIVADGLTLPGAITFDKWGGLWLLESNIIAPTVRRVALP